MDIKDYLDLAQHAGQLLEQRVGSSTLPNDTPFANASLTRAITTSLHGISWAIEAGAAAQISAFNAVSDTDPTRICGDRSQAADSTDPAPLLQPDDDASAYLKYALLGTGKASAAPTSGAARLQVSGKGRIEVGAYRRTDGADMLANAIERQIRSMPFAPSAADVRALAVGDACYIDCGGELALNLRLDWADLFTAPLLELRSEAVAPAPLVIDIGASASITVEASLSDAFRIVFVGHDAEHVRVAVNRASSRAFALSGGLIARVAFANPEQARDVLGRVAAQLFGTPVEAVTRVQQQIEHLLGEYDAARTRIRSAVATELATFDQYFERLGVARALDMLGRLQDMLDELGPHARPFADRLGISVERAQAVVAELQSLPQTIAARLDASIDGLLEQTGLPTLVEDAQLAVASLLARLQRIEAKIVAVANSKVELALAFEYRRLATDATLFDALLARQHPAFDAHHGNLLQLDLRPLLERSDTAGSGVTLQRFLHRRVRSRSFAIGFTLGAFGERFVGTREWVDVTRIEPQPGAQDDIVHRHLAFKGNREAKRTGWPQIVTLRGELAAEFAGQGPAVQGHWTFALGLTWHHQQPSASAAWLAEVVDHAALWGVLGEHQATAVAAQLQEQAHGLDGRASATIKLLLGHSALRDPAFLAALQAIADDDIAATLAAALPFGPRWHEFERRRTIAARRATYAPLCARLLQISGPQIPFLEFAKDTGRHLIRLGDPRLAQWESATDNQRKALYAGAFADVARDVNVNAVRREWRELARHASELTGLQDAGERNRRRVRDMVRGLDANWVQGYALRWQGHLLATLAARSAIAGAALNCTATIAIGEGEAPRAWVISRTASRV